MPFFWSQHYDVAINCIGHAEKWDKTEIEGDPASGDCKVTYVLSNKPLAVATISRDLENLKAEASMEALQTCINHVAAVFQGGRFPFALATRKCRSSK